MEIVVDRREENEVDLSLIYSKKDNSPALLYTVRGSSELLMK